MDNMKNYFCSPAMDRLLSQHILRVDEMPHVGLYGGKLGLIILLYHYAHFNRNKPYKGVILSHPFGLFISIFRWTVRCRLGAFALDETRLCANR